MPQDEEHWCLEHGKEEFLIIDPFRAEVYDETVYEWFCEDCEQERREDI